MGVFSIATPNGANDAYQAPVRGYLYFTLPGDQPPVGRKEWADLKALAGTGEIAAFGSRRATAPRLHRKDEAPQNPDEYVLNTGVNRMRSRTTRRSARCWISKTEGPAMATISLAGARGGARRNFGHEDGKPARGVRDG